MKLEFNENDLYDVKRTIRRLVKIKNNLLNENNPHVAFDRTRKKVEKTEKLYNSAMAIFESKSKELCDLYNVDDGDKDYYVYAHCDPTINLNLESGFKDIIASQIGLKNKPIYIGQGKLNRAYELNRNDSHRKIRTSLIQRGFDLEVVVIKDEMTLGESLLLEAKLIDIFGIISFAPNNWLVNLDEGKNSKSRRMLYDKTNKKTLRHNKFLTA